MAEINYLNKLILKLKRRFNRFSTGYENVKVRTIKLKKKKQKIIELLYFYNSPNKAEKKN